MEKQICSKKSAIYRAIAPSYILLIAFNLQKVNIFADKANICAIAQQSCWLKHWKAISAIANPT
jgi:hypothetical protein